jgi:hypothetical protein
MPPPIQYPDLGHRRSRATADVFTGSAVAIFTVVGGRVLVKQLLGEVTVAVGAGVTPDAKFQSNPTVGTTTDLCATASIASDEVGTLYGITGVRTAAMLESSSGGLPAQSNDVIVPAGNIEFICDENVTGSAKFDLWYVPLDNGARVFAA